MQELAKPLTKLTWENAALIAPATAQKLGVTTEDVVTLTLDGRKVEAPVWVLPGQAEGCVTVHLGYGRTRGGRVADGKGFDAYALRASDAPWAAPGLEIGKTLKRTTLATTQHQYGMEGRDPVRAVTAEAYRKDPAVVAKMGEPPPGPTDTLYPKLPTGSYAWGLSIDLVDLRRLQRLRHRLPVGEQHPRRRQGRGRARPRAPVDPHRPLLQGRPRQPRDRPPARDLHALRGRAVRDGLPGRRDRPQRRRPEPDGLQPLRRHAVLLEQLPVQGAALQLLPLHRLHDRDPEARRATRTSPCAAAASWRSAATASSASTARATRPRRKNRPIKDGEIVTACQQACPAQAIMFGNVSDPLSRVSKAKAEARNYGLLTELGTRPRTTYLASLSNPEPVAARRRTPTGRSTSTMADGKPPRSPRGRPRRRARSCARATRSRRSPTSSRRSRCRGARRSSGSSAPASASP